MTLLRASRIAAALALALAAPAAPAPVTSVTCDVVVAGGSLASLAAAVTAANASATLRVCFLDITDWPGGQLTASAVPAVDFGPSNGRPENIPASFAEFLWGPLMSGGKNLGNCWVSLKCFLPTIAVDEFVLPLLARFPNLAVYLSTAVSYATRNAGSGLVTGVRAVRRTPAAGRGPWDDYTSQTFQDWYDAADSAAFTKEVIDFALAPGGVVIEATEFGDVLATMGLPFAQGIEAPLEDSTGYISFCGQGTTVPFYATYSEAPAPSPDPWPPGSRSRGPPFSQQGMGFSRDWTYRRVLAAEGSNPDNASPGETSVINVGGCNDYPSGYLFYALDSAELAAQRAAPGAWRGGVNATAFAEAEQRALGCYHYLKQNATNAANASFSDFFGLNASLAGTRGGLAKMPYLRDTRRSAAGLGGFRVFKDNLTRPGVWSKAAVAWPDTIGIGQYFYADVHKMSADACPYPAYVDAGAPVKPYFLPFRALTVEGAPNVLVAGKSVATSFFANAAIRLHPEEWVTGVASGAAAALMSANGWSSSDALDNIVRVQALLREVGAPLNWTGL